MENKTAKYFKYAIGEIILVVIGILIALQINNWNEKNKDKNYELTMLEEVKIALQKDISGFEWQLEYLQGIKHSAMKLATVQNQPSYPNDSLYFHFEVVRKGGIGFSVNSSPYESLKSSGLDKVSNPKLRNSMSYLYEIQLKSIDFWINDFILKRLEEKGDLIDEIFEKKVLPDSIKGIAIEYVIDHEKLYNHPKSSAFLDKSGSYISMAIRRLSQAKKIMQVLEQQIENELKK